MLIQHLAKCTVILRIPVAQIPVDNERLSLGNGMVKIVECLSECLQGTFVPVLHMDVAENGERHDPFLRLDQSRPFHSMEREPRGNRRADH